MDLKVRNENALDNFCSACDFVASGIQLARGWRPDSSVARGSAGAFGRQPIERTAGRLIIAVSPRGSS